MYVYVSFVRRCINQYYRNKNNIIGIAMFYSAFVMACIVDRMLDIGYIDSVNGKITEYYLQKDKPEAQDILDDLRQDIDNTDFSRVNDFLSRHMDAKQAYFYEQTGDFEKIDGCIGVVTEV